MLRASTTLAENQGSVLNTYSAAHNCDSSSRGSDPLLRPLWLPGTHMVHNITCSFKKQPLKTGTEYTWELTVLAAGSSLSPLSTGYAGGSIVLVCPVCFLESVDVDGPAVWLRVTAPPGTISGKWNKWVQLGQWCLANTSSHDTPHNVAAVWDEGQWEGSGCPLRLRGGKAPWRTGYLESVERLELTAG